jgi:hypothetical protein
MCVRWIIAALLATAGLTTAADAAPIALAIVDDAGHSSGVIVDGGPDDLDPADGVVSFQGLVGDWLSSVSGSLAPGQMTLSSVHFASSTTSTLYVLFTSLGQSWTPDFSLSYDAGLQNATGAYGAFADPGDVGFAQTTGLASVGPFPGGSTIGLFGGSTTAANALQGPFSLTQLFVITGHGENSLAAGIGTLSASSDQGAVPEPASLTLLGSAFCVSLARRRRRAVR